MDTKSMRSVYAITERNQKSYWLKVGIGFVNKDGSISVRLDALPMSGTLQIRDFDPGVARAGDTTAAQPTALPS